ncbi:MAG TPA: hypothetical protein VHK27_06535 [Gammaproteobacteria bacterium]|nr:hypothetical protein [Gammaproteobacteria bacterium]
MISFDGIIGLLLGDMACGGQQFIDHSQVKLTASRSGDRDDGKFAWARYGSIPVPEDWERMCREGRTALRTSYRRHHHKVWYEEALAVVQSDDPRMLRRLVLLSWQYENQDDNVKKFLNHLLSKDISWHGEIDLDNETDRAWIADYVNYADAEAFAKLVPPRLVPDHSSGCCVII